MESFDRRADDMEVTPAKPLRSSIPWRAGIATADQALLSATNFLIAILLIKIVPKADFGYYSVAVPISLFLISLQDAVVNTPLTVLLASKMGDDRRDYVASLCYGQFLVVLPAAGTGLAVLALLRLTGFDPAVVSIAAAVCVSSAGLLYREFLRSYLFAEEDPLSVLKMDAFHVAIFLCLLSVVYLHTGIGVAAVFLLTGVSALLAALPFGRARGWRFPPPSVPKSYGENWRFGKWALLGVCVSHVQSYSYLYLLGIFSGSVEVADVSAARLLLVPLVLVQMGWGKIAIPHGSRLREEGRAHRFFKEQVLSSLLFLVAVPAYVALLLIFSEPLQTHLLTGKYASSFGYVVLWGSVFAAGFLALNASYGLQVMMRFHIITKVSFLVMLVTVGSAWFLVRAHGAAGGLVALLLGEILLGVALWIAFGRAVFLAKTKALAIVAEKDKLLELTSNPP
jgi:O-antigen/teichoic acid export membrane protein